MLPIAWVSLARLEKCPSSSILENEVQFLNQVRSQGEGFPL